MRTIPMAKFCSSTALALLVCFSTLAPVQAEWDILCTDKYCQDYKNGTGCPKISQDCRLTGKLFPSPTTCNCCEYCIRYLEEGKECTISNLGQPTAEYICGPQLTCKESKDTIAGFPTCQPMEGKKCIDSQSAYDERRKMGTLMITETRPRCDDKGDFAPTHCIHGGLCYCVAKSGERLFGEIPFTSTAHEMSCACSRAAARSALVGGITTRTARCDSTGAYDRLQCVDDKCACVDRTDAALTSDVVRFTRLSELDCYSKQQGKMMEYLTSCERERLATMQDDAIGVRVQSCQPDGGYEPVHTIGNVRLCVAPNGTQIEYFQAVIGSAVANRMNCKCARTRMTLREYGMTELPSCDRFGNYEALQCQRGLCYCVNENGDQTKKEVEQNRAQSLSCYKTPRDAE